VIVSASTAPVPTVTTDATRGNYFAPPAGNSPSGPERGCGVSTSRGTPAQSQAVSRIRALRLCGWSSTQPRSAKMSIADRRPGPRGPISVSRKLANEDLDASTSCKWLESFHTLQSVK